MPLGAPTSAGEKPAANVAHAASGKALRASATVLGYAQLVHAGASAAVREGLNAASKPHQAGGLSAAAADFSARFAAFFSDKYRGGIALGGGFGAARRGAA